MSETYFTRIRRGTADEKLLLRLGPPPEQKDWPWPDVNLDSACLLYPFELIEYLNQGGYALTTATTYILNNACEEAIKDLYSTTILLQDEDSYLDEYHD